MVGISVFKSSPATTFNMTANVGTAGSGGHYVDIYLGAVNGPGGSTGSQFLNYGEQVGTVDGRSGQALHSGNPFLPGGYANGATRWNEGPTKIWVAHTGAVNVTVRMRLTYGSINESHTAVLALPAVATVPGTPVAPVFQSATTTSLNWEITAPSNGGSAIITYRHQILTQNVLPSGADIVQDYESGATNQSRGGLTPATQYRLRYLARNAIGSGGWSAQTFMETLPAAPGAVTASNIGTQAMRVTWNNGGNGNRVTGYDLQIATSPDFAGATTVALGDVLLYDATGLNPGTTYYFRVRAKTAAADSAWSTTLSQATLPSTPPGMTVTPALSGTSASVALTPPGGSTGVTKYRVERRPLPSGATVTVENPTSPINVSGLTPGVTYEWRASAFFGTYQSPFTAWVPVIQPNPSTSPGDYFDGSTPAGGDVTFAWTGTVNNSISRSNGVGVDGWAIASTSGGELRLQRVTGGRSGAFSARMLVIRSLTGAGAHLGMNFTLVADRAEVEAGATYTGSIYVRPSRAQRLYAEIVWANAAGAEVAPRANGQGVRVDDTSGWTRLIASGIAPAGAETAIVRVRDAAGDGYSAWLSGEWLDADDAMVTLTSLFDWFSGDTPDGGGFIYDWLGTPNASVSSRTQVPEDEDDPLADPDCPPPPAPPMPPPITDECIIDVGLWRRYWVQVPASEVTTWVATIPTLTLTTGGQAAREVRMRVYSNPEDTPPTEFAATDWMSEQIVRYMPPNTTLVVDGVTERARASVDGRDWVAADHLLYGTGGAPATWPILDCGTGYLISLDVPLDADLGNLTADLALTRRML